MVAGQGRGWAETGEMGEGEVSDHLGFYSSQDICICCLGRLLRIQFPIPPFLFAILIFLNGFSSCNTTIL